MKSRLVMAALSVLAMLTVLPQAHAGGWTGCYVGAQGGYAVAPHEIGIAGLASIDGISSEGFQGGPVIGCDLEVSDRFVFGAFADYAFRSVDTDISLFGGSASVGLEDAWSVGARAGYLVTPQTLVYALVSYQRSDVNDAGTGLLPSDVDGFGGGAGIETGLAPGWSLRGEYRYVAYDGVNIGPVSIDTDEHQVRAGLVWRPWNTN